MLVILFRTYLPKRHELETYIIGSGVVPTTCISITIKCGFNRHHVLMRRETLLLRNFPSILLLTYSDAETGPDAI